MWRAVIVDDEPVIRMGIKASVDWTAEQIEVVGDYANGAEALEALQNEAVDILITDIKMPVMDGLALAGKAIALHPRIKVVLVSSYHDFDFVRQGLKIGAVDYILKHTLEPEELLQVVRKCKEMLMEESAKPGTGAIAGGALIRQRMRYEQDLKRHLVHKTESLPEGGYPEWMAGDYLAVCVRLNGVHAIEEDQGYLHKSVVLDQLIDIFYRMLPGGIALQSAENELFFVAPQAAGSAVDLGRLRMSLEEETGVGITMGYAGGSGPENVRESFRICREASERGFFEGPGIYDFRDSRPVSIAGKSLPQMLLSMAVHGEGAGLDETLAEWCSQWASGGIAPAALKEEACRVLSVMYKQVVDPYALVESFDRLFKTESLHELSRLLKEQIAELRKMKSPVQPSLTTRNPIDRALDYIHARYLESLTLQEVADAVHVSKNYFSILFKKTTGHNFIDYVIMLRIQKARELLAGTQLKVYEIAEQSGFGDVKYFSKLFKKMTGHAPVEYREKQMEKDGGAEGTGGGAG